jgi:hypothetical protein
VTGYLERAGVARELKAQISGAQPRTSGSDQDKRRAADGASDAPRPAEGKYPVARRAG